jgi:hypothetical protein
MDPSSLSDENLLEQAIASLGVKLTQTYGLRLAHAEAFILIGQLQLALRHPQNQTGPAAAWTRNFAESLITQVATTDAEKELARRGWAEHDDSGEAA